MRTTHVRNFDTIVPAHASEAQGDQDGVAQVHARAHRDDRKLRETDAQGHLNYYAVSGNHPSLWWFCNQVRWLWLKSLRRRSQKARLSWERFIRVVERFFPPIKVVHPLQRQNPREEPSALAAHAGIWPGGEALASSLPGPSPLRHPGNAHALTNAFAFGQVGWIITRCAVAKAADGKVWIKANPALPARLLPDPIGLLILAHDRLDRQPDRS